MKLFLKTHLWQIIIIVLAISLGAGWYYHTRIQGAATIATDTGNAQADFEADLTSTIDLQRGTGGPTFTRADGADRRATVTDFEGIIRPVKAGEARFQGARRVENLLTYSEDMSNASWAKTGTGTGLTAVVTANYGTAPDGTQTADRVQLDLNGGTTGADVSRIYKAATTARGTSSVWLKTADGTTKTIRFYFDSVGTQAVNISVTGTWQRFAGMATANTGYLQIALRGDQSSQTADLLVWGAQTEETAGQANQNPSEYVSTNVKTAAPYHGANVDGVKYFTTQNGNTVASNVVTEATGSAIPDSTLKGYLAEGSRTNLVTYSEQFDNAAWIKSGLTVTSNSVTAPSGVLAADTLTEDTTNSWHSTYQSGTVTAGATATFSVYLKAGTRRYAVIAMSNGSNGPYMAVDTQTWSVTQTGALGTGTYTSSSLNSLGNGWYRASITGIVGPAVTTYYGEISLSNSATPSSMIPVYVGDGASNLYIWGAQLEQASFASSYIPTTSASVTRAADTLTYPSSGNLSSVGSPETWYAEFYVGGVYPYPAGGANLIGTDSSYRALGLETSSGKAYGYYGTAGTKATASQTYSANSIQRAGKLYTGSLNTIYSNGTSGTSVATTLPGAPTKINIGYDGGGTAAERPNGTIRNVKIWKTAMSDTFLTNLTAGNDGVEKQTTVNVASGNNLAGHWAFDEASGTSAGDDSGNRNTGTLTNGPTWTTGARGGAISFDGVDDYVTGSQTGFATGTSARSIGGWINMTDTATVKVPFAYGSCGTGNDGKAFGVYLDASETLNFWGCGTADFSTGATVSTGSWHHIMVTYDGTSVRAYVDGSQVGSTTARTLGVGTTAWVVGSDGAIDTADYPFSGSIDDVRVYGRALSASEVRSLYQVNATTVNSSQNSQLTNGLVGLWSFNGYDMAGTTAYDRSGSGNNGTLTSGPTPVSGKVGQALNFNGANYVNIGTKSAYQFSNTQPFTISAWIYVDPAMSASYSSIVTTALSGSYGWYFSFGNGLLTTNGLFFDYYQGGFTRIYTSSNVVSKGSWHHVVAVRGSGNTIADEYLYVDGVDRTIRVTDGGPGSIDYTGKSTQIGARGSGGAFSGKIDEVRIYNRALSAAEVSQLYNLGR